MRNLIILAMGPTREECDYSCETWGVNTGYRQVAIWNKERAEAPEKIKELETKLAGVTDEGIRFGIQHDLDRYKRRLTAPPGRLDKVFLAHTQVNDFQGDPVFDWDELNDLADAGVEIWNTHRVKGLKAKYLDIKRLAGKFGSDYFSDTIVYMLLKALDESLIKMSAGNWVVKEGGFTHIRFYGADMHTQDEYQLERGGIEYWVGFGRAAGIDIWIHPHSSIGRTHTGQPYGTKLKIDWDKIDPLHLVDRPGQAKGKAPRQHSREELMALTRG